MTNPEQERVARLARELAAEAEAKAAAKARLNGNVVPFGSPADEEKKKEPPSHPEILAILLAMDDVEYERCRKAKAIDWGIRLSALDRIRDEAVRQRREFAPKEPQPDQADLESRLRPILDSDDILKLWLKDWDRVMAGEHANAKLIYLASTSRLFDQCMHIAVKGPSSGGKSEIRKQVLEFFPPEDVINFTSMSQRALLFEKRDFSHKILSMAEAHSFEEETLQDMLMRELMSEGVLRYRMAQVINGQVTTIEIVKRGPCSFCVTTTKAALHPENETRMLSLEIDDSEAQTKRVLKKQAQTAGRNMRPDDSIHYDWMDFQRLLRIVGEERGGWKVDVPFADALAALIPPKATRLRRDHPQILIAIKAHALIHLYKRKTNEKGEIVADLDLDYVPVAELLGHITAEGAGIAVSQEVVDTIEVVKIVTVKIPDDDGATAYEIGKKLGLDKSTAHRRLRVAAEKGFVVNLELHRNRPGKYRCTDQEVETELLLPTADQIREYLLSSA